MKNDIVEDKLIQEVDDMLESHWQSAYIERVKAETKMQTITEMKPKVRIMIREYFQDKEK